MQIALSQKSLAGARHGLLLFVVDGSIVSLDDVQREAASMLHAGCAKDGPERARCAALLPDNLPNVCRSDLEAEHGCVLIKDRLDLDGRWIINKGLGDLTDERADLGDRI
jgi:hypothetical protein